MAHKQEVLDLLAELQPHRELAEGMIALIEAGFMDKDTYKNLLFMIAREVKALPEGKEKAELQEKIQQLSVIPQE
jgi:hypothetical protein